MHMVTYIMVDHGQGQERIMRLSIGTTVQLPRSILSQRYGAAHTSLVQPGIFQRYQFSDPRFGTNISREKTFGIITCMTRNIFGAMTPFRPCSVVGHYLSQALHGRG